MPGGAANFDGGDPAAGDFVGAIRVHDGTQFLPQTDLVTTGFDMPWGMTRTFSTSVANAWGNVVGKGWIISEWPRLVEATSGVMLVAGGRNTRITSTEPTTASRHASSPAKRSHRLPTN
ncbi:MAG: hypothetical protein QM760_21925 [Nibricoccus sp.]